ncbi:MAG: hypothetical protein AVDCRST_MAG87-1716 [uncultured Thermomicrobiales bacterium]|uniref:Uncharacterized protein n=1 Tax=uncultured Thermomicrobiales bacterium TaxID=1645740 RepID=A0A6J4UZE6_9BACT|nr:MAG: hypothetical protein AVDCRST_MAG87-1716 [uncultured Thermomicrobiales bacterium]
MHPELETRTAGRLVVTGTPDPAAALGPQSGRPLVVSVAAVQR